MKGLMLHVGLLALASGLALAVWSRDPDAKDLKTTQVELWSGSVDTVEFVSYETKNRKVRLEAKKDALGRYYVGHVEKEESTAPNPHDPHNTAPPAEANAKPGAKKREAFVGVKSADEAVSKLANFKALRSVGKVDAARAEEFGLNQPEGTLTVKVGGKQHVLTVGGPTPGASERYAKYHTSGEVFAVPNDVLQTLTFAESRLVERELHGFDPQEATHLKLTRAGKTRELVRLADKKDAWADLATPTQADETVLNWLIKLNRVRVLDYVEAPAAEPRKEDQVVRVEYLNGSKSLGYLELYKMAGEKAEYWVKSEHVRWYAKVLSNAAEQVDQDATALFK